MVVSTCYMATFIVVLILFFVKRITVLTQTFIADLTMSYSLLFLIIIKISNTT
jgi:hypothetical protein